MYFCNTKKNMSNKKSLKIFCSMKCHCLNEEERIELFDRCNKFCILCNREHVKKTYVKV